MVREEMNASLPLGVVATWTRLWRNAFQLYICGSRAKVMNDDAIAYGHVRYKEVSRRCSAGYRKASRRPSSMSGREVS